MKIRILSSEGKKKEKGNILWQLFLYYNLSAHDEHAIPF